MTSVKEFAKLTGKSENAIRRKLERGTLQGVKVNGFWRVTDTSYEDMRYTYFNRYKGEGVIKIDV